jgi:short-subunit dehydrogenase
MRAKNRTTSLQHPPGFADRYGPWAVVAGASEGLGAAYARALAGRGLNLILVARRKALVDQLAGDLRATHPVEVLVLDGDLGQQRFLDGLAEACSALEIGLVVYNAAYAPIGEFASLPLDDLLRVVAVNIGAPVALVRGLLPGMTDRGRGGVVLMTSLAGNQGSPYIATYAASKAFNRVLAEGLWYELKDKGVDVVACCAGAVRTPGYSGAAAGKDAPGTLDPEEVVEQALRALGRGPVVIPGRVNRLAGAFMTRVLPRRRAISIMAGNTADLAPVGAAPTPPAPPAATAAPVAAPASAPSAAPAPPILGQPPTKDAP